MKTLRKIEVKPVYVKFIPDELEKDVIYISHEFEVSIHLCLCGCGNKAVLPFGIKNKGWNLIENNDKVSFTPSILNTNCPNKYHYIITNNVANVC